MKATIRARKDFFVIDTEKKVLWGDNFKQPIILAEIPEVRVGEPLIVLDKDLNVINFFDIVSEIGSNRRLVPIDKIRLDDYENKRPSAYDICVYNEALSYDFCKWYHIVLSDGTFYDFADGKMLKIVEFDTIRVGRPFSLKYYADENHAQKKLFNSRGKVVKIVKSSYKRPFTKDVELLSGIDNHGNHFYTRRNIFGHNNEKLISDWNRLRNKDNISKYLRLVEDSGIPEKEYTEYLNSLITSPYVGITCQTNLAKYIQMIVYITKMLEMVPGMTACKLYKDCSKILETDCRYSIGLPDDKQYTKWLTLDEYISDNDGELTGHTSAKILMEAWNEGNTQRIFYEKRKREELMTTDPAQPTDYTRHFQPVNYAQDETKTKDYEIELKDGTKVLRYEYYVPSECKADIDSQVEIIV